MTLKCSHAYITHTTEKKREREEEGAQLVGRQVGSQKTKSLKSANVVSLRRSERKCGLNTLDIVF